MIPTSDTKANASSGIDDQSDIPMNNPTWKNRIFDGCGRRATEAATAVTVGWRKSTKDELYVRDRKVSLPTENLGRVRLVGRQLSSALIAG